jgi:type I restriction enzyme, S subunit
LLKSFVKEVLSNHLVKNPPHAIYASYLIRVRAKEDVIPEYLYAFFQSDFYWSQVIKEKEGSAQPNVNGQKLMGIRLPLVSHEIQSAVSDFIRVVRARQEGSIEGLPELPPPLIEQRRIVARIEELAAKIEEARELRRQTAENTEKLMAAEENRIWPNESINGAPSLEEVTTYLSRGRHSEQGDSPHFLIKTQHVQMGRYVKTNMTLASHVAAKVSPEAMVRKGDLLIACSAAGCLGRVARFTDHDVIASTDTHVAIARANTDIITQEYLYAYLKGAQGQVQLRSRERGDWMREKVGFRLTELNLADLKRVPVPLPPISEQCRIVEYLDDLQSKTDVLKRLQAETAAELDALLPSILDKAFKGEL